MNRISKNKSSIFTKACLTRGKWKITDINQNLKATYFKQHSKLITLENEWSPLTKNEFLPNCGLKPNTTTKSKHSKIYVSSFVGEFHRQQKSKMYISTPQHFFKQGSGKAIKFFQTRPIYRCLEALVVTCSKRHIRISRLNKKWTHFQNVSIKWNKLWKKLNILPAFW